MDNHHETKPTNTTTTPHLPHVVIFPLPIQGPVNCMLKLAELILSVSRAAICVTFITTHSVRRRLALHSPAAARLARFGPAFRLESVSGGIDPDETIGGAGVIAPLTVSLAAQARAAGSQLREVLAYGSAEPDRRKPVTCVIADGFFGFMVDVAREMGLPLVYFETVSPCGLWTYLCVPKMLQSGDLPFQGDDLDVPITSVPGMTTYLRRRDLPSFCRNYDPNNQVIQLILKQAHNFPRAQGHILNTFDDLEGDLLPHMLALCPNLYNVGPLHLNLKHRLVETSALSFSNSLWQEETRCLAWLDAQPSKSVLFVSIGSLAVMTKDQFMEFWHGLVNSKARFLWARRPWSIIGLHDDEGRQLDVSNELKEGTRERGCIVSWAPQEEVLAHRAIGGFLTHSGWNSTLESIVAGVPMICWPFFVDQQVNSRLVGEIWKVGLDMKDICNRVVIEERIKDLMETRRDEFLTKVDELAKLATQAVSENGSSYNNLNRLIDDIKFMRFSMPNDAP